MLSRTLKEGWGNDDDRPVCELRDGMVFEIPGAEGLASLRTLHTPGHTPDHCAFLLEGEAVEDPVLFTGDAVLGHGTAVFEDLAVYLASLRKMLEGVVEVSAAAAAAAAATAGTAAAKGRRKGEEREEEMVKVLAFPAHGEVIPDAAAKIKEYIEHRAQRERQVLDVLREGKEVVPMDLVKVIYKGYPESLYGPAEGGVRLILSKLLGEGTVEQDGERWRVTSKLSDGKEQKAGL